MNTNNSYQLKKEKKFLIMQQIDNHVLLKVKQKMHIKVE